MNKMEMGQLLSNLKEEYGSNEKARQEFEKEYGIYLSKSTVSKAIKLNNDPIYINVKNAVINDQITYSHALILSNLKHDKLINNFLSKTINENLSTRNLEKSISNNKTLGARNVNDVENNANEMLQNKLMKHTTIKNGKIIIRYKNVSELTDIFEKLKIYEK